LGAVGYVVKPFDPLQLAGTVREVLGRVSRGEREQLNSELSEQG
jgi:DNA-binding response OmpR family regulator